MHVREMISTHPHVQGQTNDALLACIEACYDCAQTCTSCADACLGEENNGMLIQCIRRNLDCADICAATGAIASRRTGSNTEVMRAVIQACAEACRVCGEECRSHAEMHEHCRICGEACQRCEEACRAAMSQVG
ncbi:four-helix bundle copper-binding protein [Rhizobium sp. SAFR-030]|uniref:four-helix bundle copper-binding protein n=1 Tax=Rhizobium sp. SAFR-030 TaxID=3387277 RepID=UPI003F80417F